MVYDSLHKWILSDSKILYYLHLRINQNVLFFECHSLKVSVPTTKISEHMLQLYVLISDLVLFVRLIVLVFIFTHFRLCHGTVL